MLNLAEERRSLGTHHPPKCFPVWPETGRPRRMLPDETGTANAFVGGIPIDRQLGAATVDALGRQILLRNVPSVRVAT